jgi:hypothetical protein
MSPIALQRQLHYRLGQLGLAGGLGLTLLLLAALAAFTLLRSGESNVQSLERKLQALRQQVANKSSLPVNSALSQQEQLRVFYQGFAPASQLPDTLQRIYHAASKQELLLETGEYTRLQTGNERLARFRVTLPVRGSFRQILAFLDAVLQEDPTVALENASFKRDKVDDEDLEAKLSFVVLMDAQP